MALKRTSGTNDIEIGKIFRENSLINKQIGKLYRTNGLTIKLIYSVEDILLNGSEGASLWDLTKSGAGTGSFSATSEGFKLTATDNDSDSDTKGVATTKNYYNFDSIDTIEYSVYSVGQKQHYCKLFLVNNNGTETLIKTIYNFSDNEDNGTTHASTANVADYKGNYKVRFEVWFSSYDKTGYQTIRKCILK